MDGLCMSTFVGFIPAPTWLMDPRMAYLLQQEVGGYAFSSLLPRHAHSLSSFSFITSADGGSEEVSDLRCASLDPHHSFAGQGKITAVKLRLLLFRQRCSLEIRCVYN